MKAELRARARKHLDERLRALHPTDRFLPPPKGWIRAIRDALGMSGVQLAARLGVRAQSLAAIEKSEAAGTIQIDTLRRAAEALGCRLVYALVPDVSLEDAVDAQARKLAARDLARVLHTMRLEDQQTGDDAEAQIAELARALKTAPSLWDEK